MGSLKFDYDIKARSGQRARKKRERIAGAGNRPGPGYPSKAPDGSIWFLSVGQGAAFRISPER